MRAARDHVGLEIAFVTEFAEGQRVLRYANGSLERFEVQVDGAEPLEGTYCQEVFDGALPPLVLDAARHPVAGAMAVTGRLASRSTSACRWSSPTARSTARCAA